MKEPTLALEEEQEIHTQTQKEPLKRMITLSLMKLSRMTPMMTLSTPILSTLKGKDHFDLLPHN